MEQNLINCVDNETIMPSPEQFLNCDGFRMTRTFENKTPQSIVVKNRFNMSVICEAVPAHDKLQGIYIVDTYSVRAESFNKLKEEYGRNEFNNDPYFTKLKEAIMNLSLGIISQTATFSIVGFIPLSEFNDNEVLYSKRYDVILSTKRDISAIPDHPFSTKELFSLNYTKVIDEQPSVGFSIYIVDKHNTISKRYVNILGRIVDVPIINKTTMADGIYIRRHYGCKESCIFEAEVYTLSEPSSVTHVFASKEEAQANGDIDAKTKAELNANSLKLAELKLETEKQKQEFDSQKNDYEMRLIKMKAENDLAMATLKAELEKASAKRKESSEKRQTVIEMLKFVPAAVGAVVSIWVIYDKLKSKD